MAFATANVVLASVDGVNHELREEFELLRDDILKVKNKNSELDTELHKVKEKNFELEAEVLNMMTELETSTSLTAFDCHLTEDCGTPGPIQFNGCSGNSVIQCY